MASIIRLGFEGDDVKFVQQELKALGLRGLKDYVMCTLFYNSPFLHDTTRSAMLQAKPAQNKDTTDEINALASFQSLKSNSNTSLISSLKTLEIKKVNSSDG